RWTSGSGWRRPAGPWEGRGWGRQDPRRIRSDLADVRGLKTLRTARDLELHLITLGQALEALSGDGAEMDEDVLAAHLGDEAEALCVVEPLHSTVCHDSNLSARG